jgi:hypothetical protein
MPKYSSVLADFLVLELNLVITNDFFYTNVAPNNALFFFRFSGEGPIHKNHRA